MERPFHETSGMLLTLQLLRRRVVDVIDQRQLCLTCLTTLLYWSERHNGLTLDNNSGDEELTNLR